MPYVPVVYGSPHRARVEERGAKERNGAVRVEGRKGGGAMGREPPPRRNDAALLSKIASQEKLCGSSLYMYICIRTATFIPIAQENRYDGSRIPGEDFTLKYCRK